MTRVRSIIAIIFILLITTIACSGTSDPFIFIWHEEKPDFRIKDKDGPAIILPLVENGEYDFKVYWGDGTEDVITQWNAPEVKHRYPKYGQYEVRITGKIIGWSYKDCFDGRYLREILAWGCLSFGDTEYQFYNCSKLIITAKDIPDLTRTRSLHDCFDGCISLTEVPNMGAWDISKIFDTSGMFVWCENFNQDISGWDTSNVTDMSFMFSKAHAFNQDISSWNTSKVMNMWYMFENAISFNQDISKWDVSNVTNFGGIFYEALSFNQDISHWNVSRARTMLNMFAKASSFDQDLSKWDIFSVTDMRQMFYQVKLSTDNYDALLISWAKQNPKPGILFHGGFSQYSKKAEDARIKLENLYNWTIQDGGLIDTKLIKKMLEKINSDPKCFESLWLVKDKERIFLPLIEEGTYSFYVDWGDGTANMLEEWDSPKASHWYAKNGKYKIRISGTLSGWSFNNENSCKNILEISSWGALNLGKSKSHFFGCENLIITAKDSFNLRGVSRLENTFRDCSSIRQIPNLGKWDTSGVYNLKYTFSGAKQFNQDISSWDVSHVRDMSYMFSKAVSFNQNLAGWNTENVEDMSYMFEGASSFNGDLSSWNTSKVENMSYMFKGATLFNRDISEWDTSKVYNMWAMFRDCKSFNQDISAWDVSGVDAMSQMFMNAESFNQDLSGWENPQFIEKMFAGAISFDQDLSSWNYEDVFLQRMFLGVTLSTENYDALLIALAVKATKKNIWFPIGKSKYSSDHQVIWARKCLIEQMGWRIDDGGLAKDEE